MTGPGIEHGVLSTFKSVLEVDATEAGPGDLKVRVGGRRGKFGGSCGTSLPEGILQSE